MSHGKKLGVILKSNAYGHGLVPVARICDELSVPYVIVDSTYEALILRDAGIQSQVLVLGYTAAENYKRKKYPFSFVGNDRASLESLLKYQSHSPLHIFINTGMNREGFGVGDVPLLIEIIRANPDLNFEGLMSHFVQAEKGSEDSLTQKQITVFSEVIKQFSSAGIEFDLKHIDATTAIVHQHSTPSNFARIGRAFYGIAEDDSELYVELKPAMDFVSTVVNIRDVRAGESIGYGATHLAKKEMRVALIPAGYQEGVERRLSNCGVMQVRGVNCPVVGRVSMNYTSLDVSEVGGVAVGDEVVVYSARREDLNSIYHVKKICGTIAHEMMVRFDHTVRRAVVN